MWGYVRIKSFLFSSVTIILLSLVTLGQSMYFEEVESLTSSQRDALDKFRERVTPILPHDYMKSDLYLVRFLRLKDFRIRDAENYLQETLQWRQLNSMDSIDTEDFSDIEKDFPLFLDGVDKKGRVILEGFFGEWKLRTAVIAGKLPKLKRYGVKAIEDATRKVRELQYQGKNVTQWVMLLNMEGFNLRETACPSCLPYYLNFVSSYEKYYPYSVGHMVFVNTPEAFETVLNLVRPIMNAQTRKVMKVFGTNEAQWEAYVKKHFSISEISEWFGGYKPRKFSGYPDFV
ncbi:SEC14-like protein 4 [Orchesella cincta]|uniref:SEC14-like protein 4 n=1 Tax=Orchesella cincta TaxID=48709 RepID=A0A1D2MCS5_ORCCI|nr:SEC14-like protein 4 [Orchesella cincta]